MKIILINCWILIILLSTTFYAQTEIKITSGNLKINYDNPQLNLPQTRTSFNFLGNQFSANGDDTKSGGGSLQHAPSPTISRSIQFLPRDAGRANVSVNSNSFSNIFLSNINSNLNTYPDFNILFPNFIRRKNLRQLLPHLQ